LAVHVEGLEPRIDATALLIGGDGRLVDVLGKLSTDAYGKSDARFSLAGSLVPWQKADAIAVALSGLGTVRFPLVGNMSKSVWLDWSSASAAAAKRMGIEPLPAAKPVIKQQPAASETAETKPQAAVQPQPIPAAEPAPQPVIEELPEAQEASTTITESNVLEPDGILVTKEKIVPDEADDPPIDVVIKAPVAQPEAEPIPEPTAPSEPEEHVTLATKAEPVRAKTTAKAKTINASVVKKDEKTTSVKAGKAAQTPEAEGEPKDTPAQEAAAAAETPADEEAGIEASSTVKTDDDQKADTPADAVKQETETVKEEPAKEVIVKKPKLSIKKKTPDPVPEAKAEPETNSLEEKIAKIYHEANEALYASGKSDTVTTATKGKAVSADAATTTDGAEPDESLSWEILDWPSQLDEIFDIFKRNPVIKGDQDGIYYARIKVEEPNLGIDHHLLGIMANEGQVAALCIAIPGEYAEEPPAGLEGYSYQEIDGQGYWVLWQGKQG
jgi:hypothetical protein